MKITTNQIKLKEAKNSPMCKKIHLKNQGKERKCLFVCWFLEKRSLMQLSSMNQKTGLKQAANTEVEQVVREFVLTWSSAQLSRPPEKAAGPRSFRGKFLQGFKKHITSMLFKWFQNLHTQEGHFQIILTKQAHSPQQKLRKTAHTHTCNYRLTSGVSMQNP